MFFDHLKLNTNTSVAIIGSSICSCLLAEYLNNKYGVKVILYEKSKFIGGAWRSDKYGNIFSNILAPLNISERKSFNHVLKFLKSQKIKYKSLDGQSYYAGQLVKSYLFDYSDFYKNIKKNFIFRKLKVNSIIENNDHIVLNNKFKHDFVFFPNYVLLKSIKKNGTGSHDFKIPKVKIIKSKHLRILCSKPVKGDFNFLFYSNNKFGPLDRLQIIKIKSNIYKISGRIGYESKGKSKQLLISQLSKIIKIRGIIKSSINSYSSFYYNKTDIKKINVINKKFARVIHYDTQSVLGFINKYLM